MNHQNIRDKLPLARYNPHSDAGSVHRLDTPGLREYYVYFGEGADMGKVLPALKAAHPTYRLEFDHTDDLKWAQYRKWLGWAATGG